MPEKVLETVLSGQLDLQLLLKWLQGDNLEEVGDECVLRDCGRNEFTAFFLSFLRNETESIIENDSGARVVVGAGTPEPSSTGRAHRRAASDPTADTPARPHHSPSKEKKRAGRKVKTKLFTEDKSKEAASPEDTKLTAGIERLALATSTPMKSESELSSPRGESTRSPALTPNETRSRHSRHDTTFGDYLTTATTKPKKKKNSRTSDESNTSLLDTSSEIKKSSSLRSEKRRIKPTNIDLSKKSVSLNSFNTEFQKVSVLALEDNEVFSAPPLLNAGPYSSGSPGFSAERDALRRERHRLLEKFTSLSAATSPKCSTPLIKISQDDETFVTPDSTKVTCEDRINILVRIYQVLLETNLVLSYTAEICFLLALVRGKQKVDSNVSVDENSVLRSVHNAACFAVKVLRTQRSDLCVVLDRPSLRALAEARPTKTMAPDLAKSLLDVYGVRGEGSTGAELPPTEARVVAWNAETDGADNFPSTHSFHSFKKQRDMFYEIARWYQESGGVGGPSLRARVRALLATGAAGGGANYAHLGVLVARHALHAANGGGQESRLSKLQRRLTQPLAHQANSLFTSDEEFYRELLSCSENESFRAAVRDAMATELLALDSAPVHSGAALSTVCRVSCALGKLLGLMAALPYRPAPHTGAPVKINAHLKTLRSYAQPVLDVAGLVISSAQSNRLLVTLPWTCCYLTVQANVDPMAPRLPPIAKLLRVLRVLYRRRLPKLPHRTSLYLRCTLATLFAQQNIPQEVLYEDETEDIESILHPISPSGADTADIVSETELASLLTARREIAAILAGGSGASSAGPRHVTPLRVGPTPNRATQRYTHIQKRLEEAVVRSGGGGSRRVLELVCERVGTRAHTHTARALATHTHTHAHAHCSVDSILAVGADTRTQIQSALCALVERGSVGPLAALAERAVRARLARHAREYTNLCESASTALRHLVSSSWGEDTVTNVASGTTAPPIDVATAIIDLKESVCLALEGTPPSVSELCSVLETAERALEAAGTIGAKMAKRAILQLSVELCVALACNSPSSLSGPVLHSASSLWGWCRPARVSPHPPAIRPPTGTAGDSRAPTPDSDGEGPIQVPQKIVIAPPVIVNTPATPVNEKEPDPDDLTSIFANVVSPRVVQQVSKGGKESWDALRKLVLKAHEGQWLSSEQLTESCVALYRRDWPQDVLNALGGWLRAIASEVGGGGALFIGFLGEYCTELG